MSKNKIEKFTFSFILALICFSIIFLTSYLSRNCTFYGDDMSHSLYQNSIFESLFPTNFHSAYQLHGGGYLCFFLTNFFNYNLPHLLNIHPADFMSIPNGIIKGIFLCIILLSITNFGFIYKNSKFSKSFILIILSMYFFYSIVQINSFIIGFNHSFYRYIFPLLFFSYFWYFIYTRIISNSKKTLLFKNNNLKLLFAIFSGFIIGSSCEIIFSVSAISAILIISYNCSILILQKIFDFMSFLYIEDDFVTKYMISQNYNKKLNINNYKFKLDKNFYLPIISLFLSIILFVTSKGFRNVAIERGANDIHISLNDLKEFLNIFTQIYIKDEIILWIIFIILLTLSVYLTYKKQSIKKIIFPLILQSSILISVFSLILCGRTYYEEGKFWLIHPNIVVLYRIIIFYGILILYSYLCRYLAYITKNKKALNISKIISTILLILAVGIFIPILDNKIKQSYWYNDYSILSKTKKTNYISEKIFKFYYEQNKTPYLPIELFTIPMPYKEYFIWNRDCKETTANCCSRSILTTEYFPKMYADKNTINYTYCFSENAIEKFYNDGGEFTDEEIRNIKFENIKQNKTIKGENLSSKTIKEFYPIFQ